MRDALAPFTRVERTRVLYHADERSEWTGMLCRFFLYQGCHPAVLYDDHRFNPRVEGGRLIYTRPKNKRPMDMPIAKEVSPWLSAFLLTPRPHSRERYTQILKELEFPCGFPTNFLRFRHTCAVYLRRELGMPAEDVCRILGMAMGTLLTYVERPMDQIEADLRAKGY